MNTTFPFTTCCRLLGVGPKTLRHWLSETSIEPAHSPTDSRLKLLTLEQLSQLAAVYRRPLPLPADSNSAEEAVPHETPALMVSESSCEPSLPLSEEMEQLKPKLEHLEDRLTAVCAVCDHLIQLAWLLAPPPPRQFISEESFRPPQEGRRPDSLLASARTTQEQDQPPRWRPLAAELRAHRPVIPVVEYGAQGQYVIISPQAGELPLARTHPRGLTGWLR